MVLSLCWSFRKHPILAVDHSCFDFKIWYQLGSPDPQGPGSQSVCRCRCDSLTGRIIFFMRMKAKSDAVFVGAGRRSTAPWTGRLRQQGALLSRSSAGQQSGLKGTGRQRGHVPTRPLFLARGRPPSRCVLARWRERLRVHWHLPIRARISSWGPPARDLISTPLSSRGSVSKGRLGPRRLGVRALVCEFCGGHSLVRSSYGTAFWGRKGLSFPQVWGYR